MPTFAFPQSCFLPAVQYLITVCSKLLKPLKTLPKIRVSLALNLFLSKKYLSQLKKNSWHELTQENPVSAQENLWVHKIILSRRRRRETLSRHQWRGESEAVGEAAWSMPLHPPPPPGVLVFFSFMVWNVCRAVGTTCKTIGHTVEGAITSPVADPGQSPGGGPGGQAPGSSKNLYLTVPKAGSKTDQKYVDSYVFFMCIAVQSHRKIPTGLRLWILKFIIRNKMCMFYFSSWTIFSKFKRHAESDKSVTRSVLHVTTCE